MAQFHNIGGPKCCLLAAEPHGRFGPDFEMCAVKGDSNDEVFMVALLCLVIREMAWAQHGECVLLQ